MKLCRTGKKPLTNFEDTPLMKKDGTMNPDLLYTREEYARLQGYLPYQRMVFANGLFCFEIRGNKAISLPRSPVGGIIFWGAEKDFQIAFTKAEQNLINAKATDIIMTNPPHYYPGAIPQEWLTEIGFEKRTSEISHYIALDGSLQHKIHGMQKRILNKTPGFTIHQSDVGQLAEVHDFIAQCRKAQGLTINIDFELLKVLFEAFPDRYQIFTLSKNGQLAAAVIMVVPTNQIAYYFLPATHPDFKSDSPMVHLIQYLYDHYQQLGFQYIDLGISSENEKPQQSLIRFKERMGGEQTERVTWHKSLQK